MAGRPDGGGARAVAIGWRHHQRGGRGKLEVLNDWMEAQGLPRGVVGYDFADASPGSKRRFSIWLGQAGFRKN